LDFREVAPAAASRDMYLDGDGEAVQDASLVGPLASGVPGSPAGLFTLHERFGRLPWPRVVAPAERLAREGVVVDANLHGKLADARELLARFPETAAVWLPEGEPPPVGTRIRPPGLAATLRAYAEEGPEAITRGPAAERVEAVSRRHGGVLTAADLAAYRPVWREPVVFSAFGWRLASMGLPSSGAALLGETLGVLERLDWGELPRFGADRAHLLAEAFRGAFADRFLLGDPAHAEVTEEELLAPEWLARRAAGVDPERAASSEELTAYPGHPPRDPATGSGETTHLSVVDGDGGAVALTTTLNGLFGSKAWVPGLGFLNNEMDDFTTVPGEPNMFGLIQGEANTVAPGKRMLSSMSPTIAWRPEDGGAELVALGGRGGSRIPTNTAQILLNLLVDGDHLQLALGRPRIHHQWLPDRLQAEPDALAPETRAAVAGRGHAVEVASGAAKVHAARIHPDGSVEAAVDPRSTGAAAVVEPALLEPAPRRAGALIPALPP
ncbi:MAG: gamma-glutamyltransferase family protein, partial [Thermoanaerobaculia bacterium]